MMAASSYGSVALMGGIGMLNGEETRLPQPSEWAQPVMPMATRQERLLSGDTSGLRIDRLGRTTVRPLFGVGWPQNEPASREGCGCGEVEGHAARAD